MFKLFCIPGLIIIGVGAYAALAPVSQAADATGLYRISKSIPLGAPERWDYLTFEPLSNRVFAAHGDRLDVIDVSSEKVVGQVPVDGAKGYAGSRAGKSVLVFDLKTFKVVKTLPAAEDTDAIVYDPASKRVFLMQGDPHSMTVIDTATDSVVDTIHLSGQPEFAAVDGAGKLFVNIEDKSELVAFDAKTLAVKAKHLLRRQVLHEVTDRVDLDVDEGDLLDADPVAGMEEAVGIALQRESGRREQEHGGESEQRTH